MPLLSHAVTSRDDVIIPIPLFSGTQMLQTSTRSDVLKTSGRELKQYLGWKLNGVDKLISESCNAFYQFMCNLYQIWLISSNKDSKCVIHDYLMFN